MEPSLIAATPIPESSTLDVDSLGLRKGSKMSTQSATCKCCHCDKIVTYHYEKVNHKQHMWLTVFTLGLWSPMWFFDIVSKIKICDECGKPTKE